MNRYEAGERLFNYGIILVPTLLIFGIATGHYLWLKGWMNADVGYFMTLAIGATIFFLMWRKKKQLDSGQ